MAQTSYPFDGQSTTETQYSQLFREFQDSGVAASVNSLDLKVTADSTGMNVKVQPGFAIVRGYAYASTAVETVALSAADSTTFRNDGIVLRLDPTANKIELAVVESPPGGGFVGTTVTDTDIYEVLLAIVNIPANATTITPANVLECREFVGARIRAWTSLTRPTEPRLAQLGYNTTTSTWEFWNGAGWDPLAPVVNWDTVLEKPATFPPAPHQHSWTEVTNKPNKFDPTAHTHDWDQVTGKPTKFLPVSHTHHWDQIWGHVEFAPASHGHGQYLTSGETIAWANGTKKCHDRSVSGSGTYYSVWVRGDGGFCRNTSSLRFKQNIRSHEIDPDAVLGLRPVVYDRLPDEEGGDYARDEYGLVAEEVAELVPEIVTRDEEGEIDTVRYDLLGVALIPVVQRQEARINELESRLAALEARLAGGGTD